MVRKGDTKEIDAIIRGLGLSQEQRRLLHWAITGEHLTHQEIREKAKEILEDFPGKRDRRK